jgi:hypothetical protein
MLSSLIFVIAINTVIDTTVMATSLFKRRLSEPVGPVNPSTMSFSNSHAWEKKGLPRLDRQITLTR